VIVGAGDKPFKERAADCPCFVRDAVRSSATQCEIEASIKASVPKEEESRRRAEIRIVSPDFDSAERAIREAPAPVRRERCPRSVMSWLAWPAHDLTGEHVDDEGHVHEATPRRHVGQVQDHPHRALLHLGGIPASSCDDSIISRVGVSRRPGAVHRGKKATATGGPAAGLAHDVLVRKLLLGAADVGHVPHPRDLSVLVHPDVLVVDLVVVLRQRVDHYLT